jgi:hypothetical protein
MKKLIMSATALCTVGLADCALAANMPLKAPILVPPAFTWTGCYVGANGGALWAHKDWYDNRSQTLRTSQDLSSGLAGGQVGCNYQVTSWVLGQSSRRQPLTWYRPLGDKTQRQTQATFGIRGFGLIRRPYGLRSIANVPPRRREPPLRAGSGHPEDAPSLSRNVV